MTLLALSLGMGPAFGQASPNAGQLEGKWEVVACIDDGKVVTPKQVGDQFLHNRQLTIQGQTIQITQPGGARTRNLAFIADPSRNPATFDLAGAEKTGSKGIYMLSGDTLFLCLGTPQSTDRPASFGSTPGSKSILLTMQRVSDVKVAKTPPTTPVATIQPAPVKTPATPPPPIKTEADMRKVLVGTWGHQDKEFVEMITINGDGSFSVEKTWKSGMKRVFHDDVRSSGHWKLQDGIIIVQITSSTDDDLRGQVYSYRIQSLTPTEVTYVDQRGQMRREWKVR
jgi:uncharacterized protein (TIGR03067 family)